MLRPYVALGLSTLAVALPGAHADEPASAPAAATTSATPASPGCLQSGGGYLRARMRGALNLDIDWRNAEMECDGGPRPDGSGIRVSFAGPAHTNGHRLRMVFGVGTAKEGAPGHALPTNVTIIFEGEQRLFATRGDNRCTVDELTQERFGPLSGPKRSYRIVARGFCISPATTLDGADHLLMTSFDFAGNANFEDPAP